jgi:ribosomal protein S8
MTRSEIIEQGEVANGGNTSKVLEELESSGFITGFYAFGKKKKEMRFRLTDEYSLFFLKFMEENNNLERGSWQTFSQNQSWKSWSGYAFENLALRHLPQIKKALGIAAVYTESSSFFQRGSDQQAGFQIDLLIDRNDHAINVCELKFYSEELILTKAMATAMRQKIAFFKVATQTKKQIF